MLDVLAQQAPGLSAPVDDLSLAGPTGREYVHSISSSGRQSNVLNLSMNGRC